MPTKRKKGQTVATRDTLFPALESQESRLLALPRELRDEIYEHLFRSSDSVSIAKGALPRIRSSLVLVSRQVRQESEYIRRRIEPDMKRVAHVSLKIQDFNFPMIERLLDFHFRGRRHTIPSSNVKLVIELANTFETSLNALRSTEHSYALQDYQYSVHWNGKTFDHHYARQRMAKFFYSPKGLWQCYVKLKEVFELALERQALFDEQLRQVRAQKRHRMR